MQIICKTLGLTSLLLVTFGYGYSQTPLEKAKAKYEKKSTEQLANYDLFAERLTELKAELEVQLKEEAQLN